MEWVDTKTEHGRDLFEGISSVTTGARWDGFSLHVAHATSGENPEGYLLNHALQLNTGAPVLSETHVPGSGWRRALSAPMSTRFFPARVPYACRWGGPADSILVEFSPSFVARVAGTEKARVLESHPPREYRNEFLAPAIRALANEARADYPAGHLYAECVVAAVIAELVRSASSESSSDGRVPKSLTPGQLRSVLEFIESKIGNDLSLFSLASLVDTRPDQFARLFKTGTGLPPHQYVLSRRIERAKALLSDSSVSLTEIALRCGFADQSHFTRTFRRFAGKPPGAYRTSPQDR
jgi:AraC family transcriptional regulator